MHYSQEHTKDYNAYILQHRHCNPNNFGHYKAGIYHWPKNGPNQDYNLSYIYQSPVDNPSHIPYTTNKHDDNHLTCMSNNEQDITCTVHYYQMYQLDNHPHNWKNTYGRNKYQVKYSNIHKDTMMNLQGTLLSTDLISKVIHRIRNTNMFE